MTLAVVQLGARMHYAVARILHEAGVLEHLFTDVCSVGRASAAMRLLPSSVRPGMLQKLLDRRPDGIPPSKIVAHSLLGLQYAWRLNRGLGPGKLADAHIDAGRQLARRVLRHGFGRAQGVYVFNSAAVDVLRAARRQGLSTIYEQTCAPVSVEWSLLRDEFKYWAGWERSTNIDGFYRPFSDMQLEEWSLAETIICAAEFVRRGIEAAGGPAQIARVVPYGVPSVTNTSIAVNPAVGRRLRVLTVGNVRLLKGAPYVAHAARALRSVAEFRWVGRIMLSEHGVAEMRNGVTLVGSVPRSEVAEHYNWADVFLLPSLCEGSATVTYEAIQHGLPLVVTPNTAAPLPADTPGLVPIRDPDAIVAAVTRLIDDPDERQRQAELSKGLADGLTIAAYGKRLLAALPSHLVQT